MRLIYAIFLGVSCFSAIAQIEVHQEPLHHPVLSNEIARILDVIAQPGDTSLLHQHSNNYCYVTIYGGTVWLDELGKEQRTVPLPTGFIGGYYGNPKNPLVHQFANQSEGTLRLIAVENLHQNGDSEAKIFKGSGSKNIILDNAFFKILKIEINAQSHEKIECPYPTVLINLNQESLLIVESNGSIELDTWQWLDKNANPTVINNSSDTAELVLVQIKQPK